MSTVDGDHQRVEQSYAYKFEFLLNNEHNLSFRTLIIIHATIINERSKFRIYRSYKCHIDSLILKMLNLSPMWIV